MKLHSFSPPFLQGELQTLLHLHISIFDDDRDDDAVDKNDDDDDAADDGDCAADVLLLFC